jgi:hypothetical protein
LARSTVWNRDHRIAQDMPDATEDQKEISRRDNAIQKVVVSDALKEDETAPWSDTIRIVRRKGGVPSLKLIDTQTAEGSDNLLIRYAATRP